LLAKRNFVKGAYGFCKHVPHTSAQAISPLRLLSHSLAVGLALQIGLSSTLSAQNAPIYIESFPHPTSLGYDLFVRGIPANTSVNYTLDGSVPTQSSSTYAADQSIAIDRSLQFNAVAFQNNLATGSTNRAFEVVGDFAAGETHIVAVKTNQYVYGWGTQHYGKLANKINETKKLTIPSLGGYADGQYMDNAVKVAAGSQHSLFLNELGFIAASGLNSSGQLGNGTQTDTNANWPNIVKTANDPLSGIVQIAAGGKFSAALHGTGAVYTWGTAAALGRESTTASRLYAMPVKLNLTTQLTGIRQIACGGEHMLARTAHHTEQQGGGGLLYVWGVGSKGQLGMGPITSATYATLQQTAVNVIPLNNVIDVSGGLLHSAVVVKDLAGVSNVYCFGERKNGRLGNNTGITASNINTAIAVAAPTQVLRSEGAGTSTTYVPLTNITKVAAGPAHTLALDENGQVWSWGNNSKGELGDGTLVNRAFAQRVLAPSGNGFLTDIVKIATGGTATTAFSMALDKNGVIYIWGNTSNGQLGTGVSNGTQSKPVAMTSLVLGNRPPVITALNATIAYHPTGANATIVPTINDPDGSLDIVSVSYYLNGIFSQKSTGAPWSHEASELQPGDHIVTAVAEDRCGRTHSFDSTITVLPAVSMDTRQLFISESISNNNKGYFRIKRNGASNTPLQVKIATSGTALPHVDFVALPAIVTIPANALYVDVPLMSIYDSISEPVETVICTLQESAGYVIAPTNFNQTAYIHINFSYGATYDKDGDGVSDVQELAAGTPVDENQFITQSDRQLISQDLLNHSVQNPRRNVYWDFSNLVQVTSDRDYAASVSNSPLALHLLQFQSSTCKPAKLVTSPPARILSNIDGINENKQNAYYSGVFGTFLSIDPINRGGIADNEFIMEYNDFVFSCNFRIPFVSAATDKSYLATFMSVSGGSDQTFEIYFTGGTADPRIVITGAGAVMRSYKFPTPFVLDKWHRFSFRQKGGLSYNESQAYLDDKLVPSTNDAFSSFVKWNGYNFYVFFGGRPNTLVSTKYPYLDTSNGWTNLSTIPRPNNLDRIFLGKASDISEEEWMRITVPDTDGDSYSDAEEVAYGLDKYRFDPPLHPEEDIDYDGIKNKNESNKRSIWSVTQTVLETNPFAYDTDGDLYADGWEHKYGYNPLDKNIPDLQETPEIDWGKLDDDNDGLKNWDEYILGTNPKDADTDLDGVTDKVEYDQGSDPLDPNSRPLKMMQAGPVLTGIDNMGVLGLFKGDPAADEEDYNLMGAFGDWSSSKSERWRLLFNGKAALENSDFGAFEPWVMYLKPNQIYKVQLQLADTKDPGNSENPAESLDYDYGAFVLPHDSAYYSALTTEVIGVVQPDVIDRFNSAQQAIDSGNQGIGSDFIICNQTSFFDDVKLLSKFQTPEGEWADINGIESDYALLIPVSKQSFSSSLNITGHDAAGPRFRKVGLNGRPLADGKPETDAETDEAAEETYVDAFDLSLHHDTSLFYIPLASTELSLQVSLSAKETGWQDRSGLNPREEITSPFGACWSSNLCAYVEIGEPIGNAPKTDPISVSVVDEEGRSLRFGTENGRDFFAWPSSKADAKAYLHTLKRIPGVGQDDTFVLEKKFGSTLTYKKCAAWFLCSNDRLSGSQNATKYSYWRLHSVRDRYGNELRYDYGAEWNAASPQVNINTVSLIPTRIWCPQRAGQELIITRKNLRTVDKITGPLNRTCSFVYDDHTASGSSTTPLTASQSYVFPTLTKVIFPDQTFTEYSYETSPRVETIKAPPVPAGQPSDPDKYTWYFHTNLKTIKDKRGNQHSFDYTFNSSVEYYEGSTRGGGFYTPGVSLNGLNESVKNYVQGILDRWNSQVSITPPESEWKMRYGLPRQVYRIVRPIAGQDVVFQKSGEKLRFGLPVALPDGSYAESKPMYRGPREISTTVIDSTQQHRTKYVFQNVNAELTDADIVNSSDAGATSLSTSSSVSFEWMLTYRSMQLQHGVDATGANPIATESYDFDPAAGYSLAQSTGIYGDVTTWEYNDSFQAQSAYRPFEGRNVFTKWADATAKVDGLNRREEYAYSNNYRMMSDAVDVHDIETETMVDIRGRRSGSLTFSLSTGELLSEESYLYENSDFPAFMTKKIIHAFDSRSGQSWEKDLVTQYIPDAAGRLWKEVQDPDGLALTTTYTYDVYNNKKTISDPKGNITSYEYDSMNRLVRVDHPATQTPTGLQTSSSHFYYDKNGRKSIEVNENGNAKMWVRDDLGRITHEIADLDGLGVPINTPDSVTPAAQTATDVMTVTDYNAVDLPILVTDSRGFRTAHFYDGMLRPIHTFAGIPELHSTSYSDLTAAAELSPTITHTEMVYNEAGAEALVEIDNENYRTYPGSSIFASDGLKPSKTIQHDAIQTPTGLADAVSYAVYDAVFRPTLTVTQHSNTGVTFAENYAKSTVDYGTVVNQKQGLTEISTDPLGRVTLTERDGLKRTRQVTVGTNLPAAERKVANTFYTSTGLVFRVTDSLNRVTETEYDAVGRSVKTWQSDPITGLIDRTQPNDPLLGSPCTQSIYDANGNVEATINPLGHRSDAVYDPRNRKIKDIGPAITDATLPGNPIPNVEPESFTYYDLAGNVVKTTDARGNSVLQFYDRLNRPEIQRSNPVTGDPATGRDAPGAHDISTLTTYDAAGLVVASQDGNGNITRNAYDALGRLTATVTNPLTGNPPDISQGFTRPMLPNILVSNVYDDAGNLTEVADGKNQKTAFRYDLLNRKVQTIWDIGQPLARTEKSFYNALYQTRRDDAQSRSTAYLYDAHHRLSQVVYLPSATLTSHHLDNQLREYDLADRLLSVTYPNEPQSIRSVVYAYDKLDRLTSESSGGTTHGYSQYDKAGNRRMTIYGRTLRTLVSSYDPLNRLQSCLEKDNPQATTGRTTTYAYDLGSNITRKTLPNQNYTDTTRDKLGRTLTSTERNASGAMVVKFDYSQAMTPFASSYDALGNVLKIVETYPAGTLPTRTVINSYDKVYRLNSETINGSATGYAYDEANNRTAKTTSPATLVYSYGNGANGANSNQLMSFGPVSGPATRSYTYDANGNRKTRVSGTVTDTYTYDLDNRLIKLSHPSGAAGNSGSYYYGYDYRSRRVVRDERYASGRFKSVLTFSGGLSVTETLMNEIHDFYEDPDQDGRTNFYEYAFGGDPLSGWTASNYTPPFPVSGYHEWAIASISARVSAQTIINHRENSVILKGETIRGSDMGGGVGGVLYTLVSGQRQFNSYNSRGDVVNTSNDSGNSIWQGAYEALGTRTAENGSNPNRQRANTKDEDPTGLLNEGFRYRDLETGLFITRDPLGFVDGPNVYTYVRQNPWTMWDPLGLEAYYGPGYIGYSVNSDNPGTSAQQDFWGKMAGLQAVVAFFGAAAPAMPAIAASAEATVTGAAATGKLALATDVAISTAEVVAGIEGPGIPTPTDAIKIPLQAAMRNTDEVVEAAGDIAGQVTKKLGNVAETAVQAPAGQTAKLIDQVNDVSDNAMVHFGPSKFDVIKPGPGGDYFSVFRYGDIKTKTPSEVEGLIGTMAQSGNKGASKYMHVVDDVAKADEFGKVPGTDIIEYTIQGEQNVSKAVQVQE
jgi:RHS repeat-associated protein